MTSQWDGFAMCVLVFVSHLEQVMGLGCYTCSSRNNSDPGCADPFSPAYSSYQQFCSQGRLGRVGVFPAAFCIKLKGKSVRTGEEVMVRTCSLDNMDNHCGILTSLFDFEDEIFHGCLTTCNTNACNDARSIDIDNMIVLLGGLISFIKVYSISWPLCQY